MPKGNPDPWWMSCALSAIGVLAAGGRQFTAADVGELVEPPDHPCRWGSAFARAKALRLIEKVGYRPSPRPTRDGGVCAVWVGTKTPAHPSVGH